MSQKLNRRTILQSIVAVAATTAFGCGDEKTTEQQAAESRKFFPQSVASGDPRADSVVVWTRAVDSGHDHGAVDTTLRLEVSKEEGFGSVVLKQEGLKALAAHDNAIKVKVTNLEPRTTYYYRFIFEHDGERYVSPVGRTRTAPAAGDDVPVKFVFASCQDYVGRYFNSWNRLLQLNDEEVEFIVFLGDYIYETTGDPAFQSTNTLREVIFSEPAGAITRKNGIFQYQAASALSNYRDLYKNLRADPVFQKVHERYPFIVMWDDHEFSNDCWGSNATYENGRVNEKQDERRRNAEQAFFEYIPIDTSGTAAEGVIDPGSEPKYPDTRIYRDFEFGKNLKLIVTDYRTYRPDHLIPEDAYPGTVAMDKNVLAGTIAGLPFPQPVKDQISAQFANDLFAYVNIDDAAYAQHKAVLQGAYSAQAQQAGLSKADADAKAGTLVKGNLALAYINQVLQGAGSSQLAISPSGKDRGMAFLHMGKVGLFDSRGTRNIVIKDTYDLYSAYRYAATQKASENVLGDAQETWLKDTLKAPNTWKIIVSSVSLTALIFDLRNKQDVLDPTLRQRFYLTTDQWDGFPTKKQELLGYLRQNVSNAVFISGDIHASFASVESGVPTLTTTSISSGTIKEEAATVVLGAGYAEGSSIHRYLAVELDKTLKEGNPGLVFSDTDAHGFVVLEVKPNEALASYHLIPSAEVSKDYSLKPGEELEAKATSQRLRVQNGTITPA